MILVFILLGFVILACIITIVLLLCTIEFKIKKLHINYQQKKWRIIVDITISLKLFNKIKVGQITICNKIIQKWIKQKKINIQKLRKNSSFRLQNLKTIQQLHIHIKKLTVSGNFSTIEPVLSSNIYMFLQAIIPIVIANSLQGKYENKLEFLSKNENEVNIEINSIFFLKMVNIIYIIDDLKKKGRKKKNGRSSNRRSYAYGYE